MSDVTLTLEPEVTDRPRADRSVVGSAAAAPELTLDDLIAAGVVEFERDAVMAAGVVELERDAVAAAGVAELERDAVAAAGARELTLNDVMSGAWEHLAAAAPAQCPVCAGTLAAHRSERSGQLSGRCDDCGSVLW